MTIEQVNVRLTLPECQRAGSVTWFSPPKASHSDTAEATDSHTAATIRSAARIRLRARTRRARATESSVRGLAARGEGAVPVVILNSIRVGPVIDESHDPPLFFQDSWGA